MAFSPRAVSRSTLSAAATSICSPTAFDVPANATGCTKTTNANGTKRVYSAFDMNADFSSVAPAECKLCEYRQYVKGYFKIKAPGAAWITLTHQLYGGALLDPNTYNEDSCGGTTSRYGHRSESTTCSEQYLPTRATGCQYRGKDAPGLNNLPAGYEYDISLVFKADLVDVGVTPEKVVLSKTWTVACKGTA